MWASVLRNMIRFSCLIHLIWRCWKACRPRPSISPSHWLWDPGQVSAESVQNHKTCGFPEWISTERASSLGFTETLQSAHALLLQREQRVCQTQAQTQTFKTWTSSSCSKTGLVYLQPLFPSPLFLISSPDDSRWSHQFRVSLTRSGAFSLLRLLNVSEFFKASGGPWLHGQWVVSSVSMLVWPEYPPVSTTP